MRTYSKRGTVCDISYYVENDDEFCVQELENPSVEKYIYPGSSLKYYLDGELVSLYDKMKDLLFEDTEKYYAELSSLPIFVQRAGQDSDCDLTANDFNILIQEVEVSKMPSIYRHLYLVDCQFLVGTIQNLLSGMDDAFINYYVRISEIGNNILGIDEDSTIYHISPAVSAISSLLESYFTKAYSILDMFSKIAYEFEHPMQDFSTYKKLKSAKILWGEKKNLKINKMVGSIFEECEVIESIETLRNEVVHNGSWELNPKAFLVIKDNTIMERYMLFPDMVEGHLSTVKNRRHFFGLNRKVNDVLPNIHMDFMFRILKTAEIINHMKLSKA